MTNARYWGWVEMMGDEISDREIRGDLQSDPELIDKPNSVYNAVWTAAHHLARSNASDILEYSDHPDAIMESGRGGSAVDMATWAAAYDIFEGLES